MKYILFALFVGSSSCSVQNKLIGNYYREDEFKEISFYRKLRINHDNTFSYFLNGDKGNDSIRGVYTINHRLISFQFEESKIDSSINYIGYYFDTIGLTDSALARLPKFIGNPVRVYRPKNLTYKKGRLYETNGKVFWDSYYTRIQ